MKLTGAQLQRLMERYGLSVGLEDGTVTLERKDGKVLKASTVAKMVGLAEVPENWNEAQGQVRNV